MKLANIERVLKKIRMDGYNLDFKDFSRVPQRVIIERIEAGQPYAIKSLLNYISAMNLILTIDNKVVYSTVELGAALKEIRIAKGIIPYRSPGIMNMPRQRLYMLEKGHGNRNTFNNYLNALDIELNLRKQ